MTIIRKQRCIGSIHPAFIETRAQAALQNIFWRRAPMWHASWSGFLRRIEHRKQTKIRKACRALSDAMWDVIEAGATSNDVASYLIQWGHWPHELKAVIPNFGQIDDEAAMASEREYERMIGA